MPMPRPAGPGSTKPRPAVPHHQARQYAPLTFTQAPAPDPLDEAALDEGPLGDSLISVGSMVYSLA